jgi:hypothetical protein
MKKTSVLHRDIGKHEHEVTVFDSYAVYAVCKQCGMRDWSCATDDRGGVDYCKKIYPRHEIVDSTEEMREEATP